MMTVYPLRPIPMKTALISVIALSSFLLAGCDSTGVQARIQEKSAAFAALTPAQKKSIEDGSIEVGFTADMVYMALGRPSKTKEKTSADGKVEMWTYSNYYTSGASNLALNDPGRQGYRGGQVGMNTPRNETSISSTKSSGPEPGLEPGLIPTTTLLVFFHNGVVVQIKTEK